MTDSFKMGQPIILKGSPYEQGMLQAECCPEMVETVRNSILEQLNNNKALLRSEKNTAIIKEQLKITETYFPETIQEIKGIAKGFKLNILDLFNYYLLRLLLDMDGCSTVAVSLQNGSILGKNRDLAASSHAMQRVFIHDNPGNHHKKILFVGSLGAPCGYSSGMNTDGFCLADTNIPTTNHGPGLYRYFLMGHLLRTCTSVNQALETITSLPHSGGGALVIADKTRDIAAVEMGHTKQIFKKNLSWLVKTNHFIYSKLSLSNITKGRRAKLKNSMDRLQFMNTELTKLYQNFNLEKIFELLKSHDPENGCSLCRHFEQDSAATISGVVYTCAKKKMYFSNGNPCNSEWYEFSL